MMILLFQITEKKIMKWRCVLLHRPHRQRTHGFSLGTSSAVSEHSNRTNQSNFNVRIGCTSVKILSGISVYGDPKSFFESVQPLQGKRQRAGLLKTKKNGFIQKVVNNA
jgi:hypothetical protein